MARERKLFVEELLTKPSAVTPMLFVGLGGCGCRIVKRISEHLRQRPDFEERYHPLVKFAMVDTNVNDLESYREIADETFLVSDFEKELYANLASGKQFLEADHYFTQWVPPEYRFRAGDTAGAGQIRIESRLGVYYQMKHKDFVPRFRKLLEELKSHEHGHRKIDSDEILIVLCYSIAGGTGSGCHLPIAYMLRDQARELGRPRILGVAVMPAVFQDKTRQNKDGTYANGYAALKETEHLMKLGAPDSNFYPKDGIPFHYDPSDDSKEHVWERPFEFVYVVDKPESFSVPEPIDAAADGLYLQFFSPLFEVQMSDYDNYTQYQRFLVPHDFEGKGIPGFTSFYGSYGAAVLLVPVDGLVDYCSQAASLSLMRSSFLGEIPGDPVYNPLRINADPFYQVTLRDGDNEKDVHVSEFDRKNDDARSKLLDRLFMKRVRLLAACEMRQEVDGRFSALFRHGHRYGERPRLPEGGFEYREELLKVDREHVGGRLSTSIGAIVLEAVAGKRPGQEAGLLKSASDAMDAAVQSELTRPRADITVKELKSLAERWLDDLYRIGLRKLDEGYKEGTISYPGMDSLIELDFMRDKEAAGGVDLAAKRYATLRILEEVNWNQQVRAEDKITEFEVEGYKETTKVRADKHAELFSNLEDRAKEWAMQRVKESFLNRLGQLKKKLEEFTKLQRGFEAGFKDLEREQSRRLERLRSQGDESANRYVLDAEALQGEDGRRFWDFYYADKVANLQELSLDHPEVQQVLSETVIDLSASGSGAGTTEKLDRLFTDLRKYAERFLKSYIGGDPHSPDSQRREGLTLSDALELEVVYRALYRNHAEKVTKDGFKEIQHLVAEYNHRSPEKKIDFGALLHQDYLRDKIKRVVKEKASLLCVYEGSRDQHGGVRPDHVFLAAIDANFKNSNIEEALKRADIANLEWVSTSWHNPKEVIFYRAVLNVPLYVFGRLDQMKHHYDMFKSMSRRSKALHIDRNWEGELPDLDPNSAKETHRKKLVRNEIINFTALLKTPHPRLGGEGNCILRRNGRFYLLDPELDGDSVPEDHERGLAPLGDTMSESVQKLREVFSNGKAKYLEYQFMLNAVRDGLSPALLAEIVQLPITWRRQREELRNQYGSQLTVTQKVILNDLSDAYSRLQEALDSFLEELRNREIEGGTLGEDYGANTANLGSQEARDNLRQSVQILSRFSETWRKMEDPNQARHVPPSFGKLFKRMEPQRLQEMLARLTHRDRQTNGNGAGAAAPPPEPKAQSKDKAAPTPSAS